MIGQHAFGSRLRTQRERRGISLAAIADSTKIKLSLLDSLERGDASQWPRGLFRRAYLRDYAAAIGLPAEPLVAEFTRLFPEDGSPVDDVSVVESAEPMRLSFPAEPPLASERILVRAQGAAIELAVVAVVGLALKVSTGWDVMPSLGTAALVYYPVATALTGRTLSVSRFKWLADRWTSALPASLTTEQADVQAAAESTSALPSVPATLPSIASSPVRVSPTVQTAVPASLSLSLLPAVPEHAAVSDALPLYLVPRTSNLSASVPPALLPLGTSDDAAGRRTAAG